MSCSGREQRSSAPRRYGAWWLPFVGGGFLAICASLPLLCCGEIPKAKDVADGESTDEEDNDDAELQPDFGRSLADLADATVIFAKNGVFLGLLAMMVADGFVGNALTAFGPKLAQVLYNMNADLASIVMGAFDERLNVIVSMQAECSHSAV